MVYHVTNLWDRLIIILIVTLFKRVTVCLLLVDIHVE